MSLETALFLFAVCAGPVADPAGDVYLPGSPGDPALGTIPDLLSGAAVFDGDQQELRFEFSFSDSVFPADDFDHIDNQLRGYVDIDLDVPPVGSGNSWKSQLSGFQSNLGIEAYVDLNSASGGTVDLLDSSMGLLAQVPIAFEGSELTITVPFSPLYGAVAPGDSIAYAAYFYDFFQFTADVFPNGDGYLLSEPVPEPGSAVLMAFAFGGWFLKRPRIAMA